MRYDGNNIAETIIRTAFSMYNLAGLRVKRVNALFENQQILAYLSTFPWKLVTCTSL